MNILNGCSDLGLFDFLKGCTDFLKGCSDLGLFGFLLFSSIIVSLHIGSIILLSKKIVLDQVGKK